MISVVITAKSTYCGLMVVHDAEIGIISNDEGLGWWWSVSSSYCGIWWHPEVVMGMLKALSLSNWWFAGASYQGGDSRMVAATNVVSGGMVVVVTENFHFSFSLSLSLSLSVEFSIFLSFFFGFFCIKQVRIFH